MRFLVAEKLGPHKFKTPEGYLICTDAILSRTGKQEYKRCEIFGDACDEPDKIVNVDRVDAEVFSDKAMASFENKPICIEHPDHDVNAENHNELAVGFVRDVHKGEDNGHPVMMGTLVITDKDAVEAVESGEYKELSCGYDCDIDDDDEPRQRNIRGNHVALCKHGRAGIARIVDSKMSDAVIKTIDLKESKHRGDIGSIKLNLISANECWISIEGLYEDDNSGLIWISGRTACVKVKKDNRLTVNIHYAITSKKSNRSNRIDVNIETTTTSWKEDVIRYVEQTYSNALHSVKTNDSVNDSLIDDGFKDVSDLTKFKMALRSISKMYSNDPGIEYVTSILRNLGYEVTVDSIDGWRENKNVPGEHIKKYRMNVILEGKERHFLVELYADMGVWKVKEINAYMLDSNNIKQGEHMKDTKLQDKYVLYQRAGVWYGTKQENYEARIQNANAIQSFKAFNSVNDIIEYLSKYGNISKEDIIVKDFVKDEDFSRKTKQGFRVLEMYRDGGRLHVIFKRANDYGIGLGYDTTDGQWSQGRYDFSTLEKARQALVEEKPYARRIQDDIKDEDMYIQVDMTDKWGGVHSFIVKSKQVEEAKAKVEKRYPELKYKTSYQASESNIAWAKRRNLLIDDDDDWSSVEEENYNKANKPITDDEYVQLPRGRFKLVAKTKEELEKEGYGYHHSANGYSVYVKNNNAVAIKDAEIFTKDSKEQLFTVEYEQNGVMYIRKVRANSIEDAIKQVKRSLTDEFNTNTLKSKPFNTAIDLLKRNGFEIKFTGVTNSPAGSYTNRSNRSAFLEATNPKTFERVLVYAPVSGRIANVTNVTSEVSEVTLYKYKNAEELHRYTLHK